MITSTGRAKENSFFGLQVLLFSNWVLNSNHFQLPLSVSLTKKRPIKRTKLLPTVGKIARPNNLLLLSLIEHAQNGYGVTDWIKSALWQWRNRIWRSTLIIKIEFCERENIKIGFKPVSRNQKRFRLRNQCSYSSKFQLETLWTTLRKPSMLAPLIPKSLKTSIFFARLCIAVWQWSFRDLFFFNSS